MSVYDSVISRSDSAALMPEEVSNKFLSGLTNKSAVLSTFTRIPVGRAQLRLPILSALPTAYFVNPTDTGLKQTTEVNWDNKYLNIEEVACIVPVPDSVLDDAEMPIWDQVQPLCEDAAARTIDSAVFFGTNQPSSWGTAIVTQAQNAGNYGTIGTNGGTVGGVVADQNTVLSAVEADGYDPTTGVASRQLRGTVRQARNSYGDRFAEIAVTKDTAELDGVSYTFPMRGLWPTSGTAAQAVMFDPTRFVAGVRQDVTWKLLDQAVIQDGAGAIQYNLAQQDMVALRLVIRVGWQVDNSINYDQATESSRYPAGVLLKAYS